MKKLSAMRSGGDKSHKEQKGYSKVGGIFKSKETKAGLEKTQARLNSFSARDKSNVKETLKRNTATPGKDELNDYGAYKGDQKFRYKKRPTRAKFESR